MQVKRLLVLLLLLMPLAVQGQVTEIITEIRDDMIITTYNESCHDVKALRGFKVQAISLDNKDTCIYMDADTPYNQPHYAIVTPDTLIAFQKIDWAYYNAYLHAMYKPHQVRTLLLLARLTFIAQPDYKNYKLNCK